MANTTGRKVINQNIILRQNEEEEEEEITATQTHKLDMILPRAAQEEDIHREGRLIAATAAISKLGKIVNLARLKETTLSKRVQTMAGKTTSS